MLLDLLFVMSKRGIVGEQYTRKYWFEKRIMERMSNIFQDLIEICRNDRTEKFEYEEECIDDTKEPDMSTQILRIKKSQLIDLK